MAYVNPKEILQKVRARKKVHKLATNGDDHRGDAEPPPVESFDEYMFNSRPDDIEGPRPNDAAWTNEGNGQAEAYSGPRGARPSHAANSSLSAKELNAMRFDPIKYVVPGIIVEGLTLLAAKPKIGKSWLMLHAAFAVARGGFTLGDIHCAEGDVFYCALEDNLRRLQSRMTKLIGTQEWPSRLFFRCEMPRLAEGGGLGLKVITDWIASVSNPRLVIVDTLAMVRMPNRKDQSTYDADYSTVQALRTLANQHGVAIVLVHHLRKADADDAFDTVSGTLGLTGAPDSILILKRDATGHVILHGRGRDLVEIEKAMTFNSETCIWTIAGDPSAFRTSGERKAILEAMKEIGEPAGPNEVAAVARLKPQNVRRLLIRMIKDGLVQRRDYGKYEVASVTANPQV
jgi:AAA domain